MKAYSGSKCIVLLYLISVLDWGRWSQPRPDRFTSVNDPVPPVQEAEWAPGLVWMGAENLAPTEIRSPDRPTRSESRQTTQDIWILYFQAALQYYSKRKHMSQPIHMFILYVRAGNITTQAYR